MEKTTVDEIGRHGAGAVKLDPTLVRSIRFLARDLKWTQERIAEKIGVSRTCVHHALSGRVWTWVAE